MLTETEEFTEIMPPKNPPSVKIEIRLTPLQVERADKLADLLTTDRPDILRSAIDLGLAQIEQRLVQQYAFENALLVNAKLKRRGDDIKAAIKLLEENGGSPEAIDLLKGAIG